MKLATSLLILGVSIALTGAMYVPNVENILDIVEDDKDVGVYGPKIRIYEHDTYTGGYQDYTTSAGYLSGFGDRTSSVIVYAGIWVLYKDSDFRGTQWVVTPDSYPDPGAWDGGHDNISSLRLLCS